MTEKKEGFKLVVTAKEFVPKSKDRKSVDQPDPAAGTGTAGGSGDTSGSKVALNPSAKEFVPRMPVPEMVTPVVYVVPTFIPMPGVEAPVPPVPPVLPEGTSRDHG